MRAGLRPPFFRHEPFLVSAAAAPGASSHLCPAGLSRAASFAERVAKIHALAGKPDCPGDPAALHATCSPRPRPPPERRQEENWLRNDLLDKLTAQAALPKDLVQLLVAIYQDPAQDMVMRDYAVQHMRPAYSHAGTEEQRDILQQALWNAVTETDSSIAGTALLALQDLARDYKEIQPDMLGEAALNLAGDERCGELSRITAVQVCGRLGWRRPRRSCCSWLKTPPAFRCKLRPLRLWAKWATRRRGATCNDWRARPTNGSSPPCKRL